MEFSAVAPREQGQVSLKDGRSLAWCEWGPPRGRPVLFHHGLPGSRLCRHPDAGILERAGVRLITVDRPGFGASTFLSKRRLADWAQDVEHLMDDRGLEQASAVGWSGGAPHALAAAWGLPHRIRSVGLLAPPLSFHEPGTFRDVPLNLKIMFGVGRFLPFMTGAVMGSMAAQAGQDLRAFLEELARSAPKPDRAVLLDPGYQKMESENLRECFRAGSRGISWEVILNSRPWGFPVEKIQVPVHLWHGEHDRNVPPERSRLLADRLPRARLEQIRDEGHYSLFVRLWERVLAVVTDRSGPGAARSA